jgi:hypothetical protein
MSQDKEAEGQDAISRIGDWSAWHDAYADPNSELNSRMRSVQAHVAALVRDAAPGPVTIVSICAGQGREVIGALEGHLRRGDVRGRLVELAADNAAFARAWTQKAELNGLEVVAGDASLATSYEGLAPADIVVISGVFGHLSDDDQKRLIAFSRQICRRGGSVVWTNFAEIGGRRAETLRDYFRAQLFEEAAFETLSGKYAFTIAHSRYAGEQIPLDAVARLFSFGSSRR